MVSASNSQSIEAAEVEGRIDPVPDMTELLEQENQLTELSEIEKHQSTTATLPSEHKLNVNKPIQVIKSSDYEFEQDDKHENMQVKKKTKIKGKNRTKRKNKLATRRSVSLPILQSRESLSSSDSQDGSSFQLKDKTETLNIVKTVFQLDDDHQVVVEPVNKLKRGDPLRKTLLIPIRLWREIKILPNEDDVCNAVEPAKKFSKIDTISRKVFPLAFVFVTSFYALLYMYYITDDSNIEDLSNFDILETSK